MLYYIRRIKRNGIRNQLQGPVEDICRKSINRSTVSADVYVILISIPNRKAGSNHLDLQIPRYRGYLISVVEPYQWSILVVSSLYPHCILIPSSYRPYTPALINQKSDIYTAHSWNPPSTRLQDGER